MPQDSALYGIARIRCHEKNLIGRDKMQRLIDGNVEEAVRLLVDAGYGGIPDATVEDAERLITSELGNTYALIREISFDSATTDLFLMKADVNNIKLLMKLKLTDSGDEPLLMRGGLYSQEALMKFIAGDYRDLPEEFREALSALEQNIQTSVEPAAISIALDRAYVQYAFRTAKGFAASYFRAQADFDNVIAMLRIRSMGGGTDKLRTALLPEGDVPASRLAQAMDAPIDGMAKLIATGPARDGILRGLDAIQKGMEISVMERERDNCLISLANAGKLRDDSIAPVVGYLLAREQEAKCIRIILTAKRNGLPDTDMTERLRELYG